MHSENIQLERDQKICNAILCKDKTCDADTHTRKYCGEKTRDVNGYGVNKTTIVAAVRAKNHAMIDMILNRSQ